MINGMLSPDLITKFLKFGVVGASGMVVDFGITFLLKEKVRVQKYVANAIGFTIAVISNYMLNRWWTFESMNHEVVREFSSFALVAVIGLGINSLILWMLVSKAKFKFYLSKLLAIGVVTFWNFCANYFIIFPHK
ncbi:MAG: GtrA family protein [Bacteroidota bacterium]